MIYNTDYQVPQYCDGTNWVVMAGGGGPCGPSAGPINCPNIGDECDDGTVYAGDISGVKLYTTHCDAGQSVERVELYQQPAHDTLEQW